MTKLILNRIMEIYHKDKENSCILGELIVGNNSFTTLENCWLDNQENISCIPAIEYKWKKHISPKNGNCILVEDVPERTNVLFHIGNYAKNTEGCILVGERFSFNNQIPMVTNSTFSFKKLLSLLGDSGYLVINNKK